MLRLFYLLQFQESPFFTYLLGDGKGYLEWGAEIASGDWIGTQVFYQAPLYPYFLGFIQVLFEDPLWPIRLTQSVMGSLGCVCLYLVGKRLLSQEAGVITGVLAALYAPAIFFDGLLQKASVGFFLFSLALWQMVLALETEKRRYWFSAGVVLGLLSLIRENAALLIFVWVVWPWIPGKFSTIRTVLPQPNALAVKRFVLSAMVLMGVGIVLLPVGFRNWVVGDMWTFTTSQLGPNLYMGNNPKTDGMYYALRYGRGVYLYERNDAKELAEEALGRPLTSGEVSSYWVGKSIEFAVEHPLDWMELNIRKWLLVWNRYELNDTDDYYLYQTWSPLLSSLDHVVHFGLVSTLAVIGLFLTAQKQWRRLLLFYVLAAALLASILPFAIHGRYRFVLLPLLLLFAGAGAWELKQRLQHKLYKSCGIALFAGGISLVMTYLPMVNPLPALGYYNLALAYQDAKDYPKALDSVERALVLNPGFPEGFNLRGNIYAALQNYEAALKDHTAALQLVPSYIDVYRNRGHVYLKLGQHDRAIQEYTRALEEGGSDEVYFDRGLAYVSGHFYEQAVSDLNVAIQAEINLPDAYAFRGWAYAQMKQFEPALKDLNQALALESNHASAYSKRGVIYIQLQQHEAALADLNRALEISPELADAYDHRGKLYFLLKQYEQAVNDWTQAIRFDPKRIEAYNNRGTVAMLIWGRKAEACSDWKKACELGDCQNYQLAVKRQDCE